MTGKGEKWPGRDALSGKSGEQGAGGTEPSPEVLRPAWADGDKLWAGFTTRRGGYSAGPFAELNFSRRWTAPEAKVEENLALLARTEGFDAKRLFVATQVHGADGLCVDDLDREEVLSRKVDFLSTGRPGNLVGIITADCIPILLWDPAHRAVAAAHAGWRGVVAGVVEAVVGHMAERYGARTSELWAALGPAIGPCCFEVGPEVAEQFTERSLVVRLVRGRPHVDLHLAVTHRLERLGLDPGRVEVVAECTACNPDRYHSYRRDGSPIGQHLSFIGFKT